MFQIQSCLRPFSVSYFLFVHQFLTKIDREIKILSTKMDHVINELNMMTNEGLQWLKIQYRDVCSGGDVIINKILDMRINKKIDIKDLENMKDSNVILYMEHIIDSYQGYLNGDEPNPHWAS